MKSLLVLGCILFEGQGVEETKVIEVDKFLFVEGDKIDEFGENYLDNGGDSYSTVEGLIFNDKPQAKVKLTDLETQIKEDLREAIISSHKDELSEQLNIVGDLLVKLS